MRELEGRGLIWSGKSPLADYAELLVAATSESSRYGGQTRAAADILDRKLHERYERQKAARTPGSRLGISPDS